jgi:hypothetical protein
MQNLGQTGQLYPDFNKFMGNIDRINPLYSFVFSVFRLGQATEQSFLETFVPTEVIEALIETGLLVKEDHNYRMPEVGILPQGGMYYVTSLPEIYPTVSRNCRLKPADNMVQLLINEMISLPVGFDFFEYNSDYGILANMAAARGFKNIRIYPKHADYIPFIKINLELNNHNGKVTTDFRTNEYDLIAGIYLSVKEKVENRNLNISDEEDIVYVFPVLHQLKATGQALLILESLGSIAEIKINEQLKKINKFNTKSVILSKMQNHHFLISGYNQSSWEKQFELFPDEYVDYVQKAIESSGGKVFVFIQLLKINKQKTDEPFVLFPFYNPKYSDPSFNYASLLV